MRIPRDRNKSMSMYGVVTTLLAILKLSLPIASSTYMVVQRSAKIGRWFLRAALVSIGCYILLNFAVKAEEIDLQSKVFLYDLNGDGLFSGEELTPEQEQAMDDLTNDTGRSLAPITGLNSLKPHLLGVLAFRDWSSLSPALETT